MAVNNTESAELVVANTEIAFQNQQKEKRAAELNVANKELAFQNEQKEQRAAELIIANKELAFQNELKGKRAAELIIANKELAFQNEQKEKRAAELSIANKELAFQNEQKEKRAAELIIANEELAFQNDQKEKRADELIIANKELAFQNEQKGKRAAELFIANEELAFQNEQKEKRAAELSVANKELAFQNEQKEKRAAELIIANEELAFQNDQKEKRAAELIIANKELAYQNELKGKRAADLVIANDELAFQNEQKEKRAAELIIANKELLLARTAAQDAIELYDFAPTGYFTLSKDHEIINLNLTGSQMLGKERSRLINKRFSAFVTVETKPHFSLFFEHVFSSKIKESGDVVLCAVGDEPMYVHLSGIIAENDERCFVTAVDITERRQTEEASHHRQKMESIGVLAGGIAHDFNNLLMAMMGNVSLAKLHMPDGHPAMKNLDRTLSAMERAATLTKQMLAYSGKGRFQVLTIDMVAMVREHLSLFEVTLPKNVKLHMNLSSTPVCVKGDPGQMEQIVMNLIINGGEAIGEKQGAVHVEVSPQHLDAEELKVYRTLVNSPLEEGDYVLLQVSDNGCGMNDATLHKIFDPFFTTKFVGRGLGLSAVLGIIRGHNGGIVVESTEGVGTTFRVVLPLTSTPLIIDAKPPVLMQLLPTTPSSVLVIDDELEVIQTVSDILEVGKYVPMAEQNPLEGIKVYEKNHTMISVVILDLSMPEMNGEEVLVQLQQIDPKVKVILSSGYSEEEAQRRLGDVKATAFIQKPYNPNTLLSLLSEVMQLK